MKEDDKFVPVRTSDIKAWRENWLEHNEPEELGTDIVTPFDHYLYGWPRPAPKPPTALKSAPTGLSNGYYRVHIASPNQAPMPYTAECGDVIEALGMDFNDGNAFKALWRKWAAITLGVAKTDYPGALYDTQKAAFYTGRSLILKEK